MKAFMLFRINRLFVMGMFFSISLTGCAENDATPDHPIEVRFQLLNSIGETTTSFNEGEDIIFDYRMVNKSNKEVFWFKDVENYKSLFNVSRLMPNQSNQLIGTPHDNMKIYLNALEMQGSKLGPKAEIVMRMTWKGDWNKSIFFNTPLGALYDGDFIKPFEYKGNNNLPKGNYVVEINHTLKFVDFQDLNVIVQMPFAVH